MENNNLWEKQTNIIGKHSFHFVDNFSPANNFKAYL